MPGPITQTEPFGPAGRVLMSMSKMALADLVVDLIRAQGGEALDGEDLAAAVRQSFFPIALIRGDRVPK